MRHLRRLLSERKIELELTPAARQHLAEVGYDPLFGARPLKRAIQREIQDPLAMALLEGEFSEGDTIRIDFHEETIVFEEADRTVPEQPLA